MHWRSLILARFVLRSGGGGEWCWCWTDVNSVGLLGLVGWDMLRT